MKRIFAASTLTLALCAGSSALAVGPDHTHKEITPDKMVDATAPAKTLADFVELPELSIGSKAPELAIAKFVKGDSVDGFDAGQVYVVEFWATWCGPCVAAFPHLSDLQEEHGEKVRFIGVNVWEGVDNQADRIAKVEAFVKDQDENMRYTVAVEDGSAMADTWMKPAAQNGIPAAFIVDGTGHIAWVGHPGGIDKPLNDVIEGNFDASDAKNGMLMSAGFNKLRQLVGTGENLEEAREIANLLIDNHLTDEPGGLNAIAWMIITAKSENIGDADYKLAHRAIAIACEKTQWKDWSLLDTYALAAFKTGNTIEAIKWQKKAIELAPADSDDLTEELADRLAEYQE